MNDLHRPPTQHITWPNQNRVANLLGDLDCLIYISRGATRRLSNRVCLTQGTPLFAVFGDVNAVAVRSGNQICRNSRGKFQRSLAAQTNNHLWLHARRNCFSLNHV